MQKQTFSAQLDRLKSMWPNSFGAERVNLIFNAVKSMPDFWMEQTCNQFIADWRGAPVLKDFIQKINEQETRDAQNRVSSGGGFVSGLGFLGELEYASKRTSASKEFVGECLKLLRDRLNNKISQAQFLQGCDLLDKAAGAS
jgi:hypothetical protein